MPPTITAGNQPLTIARIDQHLKACAYQMRNAKDPIKYHTALEAANGWLDRRLKVMGR
jgi:C4-dicarboxylate-specific signal transduction histidine kinase